MAILVITCKERHPRTNQLIEMVSHGVDMDTGRNIVLQNEPLQNVIKAWGLIYSKEEREYYIPD